MTDITTLAAHIVASAAANEASRLRSEELVDLIRLVKRALKEEGGAPQGSVQAAGRPKMMTKAQWSKLLTEGRIKSLIDGKMYASLSRHLRVHGYDADSYRAAFGLPKDFPMISPAHSAMRRHLAVTLGLGGSKSKAVELTRAPAAEATDEAKTPEDPASSRVESRGKKNVTSRKTKAAASAA